MTIEKCEEMIAQFVSYLNMATGVSEREELMNHIERYKKKLELLRNT